MNLQQNRKNTLEYLKEFKKQSQEENLYLVNIRL